MLEKVITTKSNGGGTLPISTLPSSSRSSAQKPAAAKLKMVIRRLPPTLERSDLEGVLGDYWKVGSGKVSWLAFKRGKVYKDSAKAPRPSRAYLQLVDSTYIEPLAAMLQGINFGDARNEYAPTLEFAVFQRVAASKKRSDPRQGLIDLDPEFIGFLETLTSPVSKPLSVDSVRKDEREGPITNTPLIQHLREKKAAKEKARVEKANKTTRSEPADSKVENKSKDADNGETKAVGRRRKAESKDNLTTPRSSAKSTSEIKKKEKSVASVIQRDLGIREGKSESARRATTRSQIAPKPSNHENTPPNPALDAKASSKASPKPPSVLKRQSDEPGFVKAVAARTQVAAKQNSQSKVSSISASATKAFLKHANPSQGITEAKLLEALSLFGTVIKVEIDKRKGFGYADFADPKGLQAAVSAGLIQVAQGNIQVLERKERTKASSSMATAGQNTGKGTTNTGAGTNPPSKNGNSSKGARGNRSRATNAKNSQAPAANFNSQSENSATNKKGET